METESGEVAGRTPAESADRLIVNEQELVKSCRLGNREAQRELYDRTSEPIYRLLLRMTGNRDDAFDLAQDTYVKAFTRIEQFDGRSSVATWLYRVAVNEALQHLRRASRTRIKLHENPPADLAPAPAEVGDIRLDIQEAVATLPPSDRAMLFLRYQEGLDYRAIAEVCDCATGTVASRLNRARRELRNYLQKSYGSREVRRRGGHPKNKAEAAPKAGLDDGRRQDG